MTDSQSVDSESPSAPPASVRPPESSAASEPPPEETPNSGTLPRVPVSDELDLTDEEIIEHLRSARLMVELNEAEAARILPQLGSRIGVERMLDLVELYYEADDELASKRRRLLDRYFVYRANEPVHAGELLARLRETNPELPKLAVEQIGAGGDAALVLRSGENFAGIVDEFDEELETGETDLRTLEDQPTVSVGGLVNAVNFLLEKVKVRERLVALRSDGTREVYVAVAVAASVTLCQADLLEEEDPGAVMEKAGW